MFRVHRVDPYNLPRFLGGGNVPIYHKVFATSGYYQNPIGRYDEITDPETGIINQNINFLALTNVKYLISAIEIKHPYFERLPSPETVYFYQNKAFLPRFFFSHAYEVIKEPGEIIKRISFLKPEELSSQIFLEEKPGFTPLPTPRPLNETVTVQEYTANRISLNVELTTPGFLVMSEVYYPAWEAEVDGQPTKILRANYFMRALPLSAGRHQIIMRFNPRTMKIGLFVTIGSSIICLFGMFLTRKRLI